MKNSERIQSRGQIQITKKYTSETSFLFELNGMYFELYRNSIRSRSKEYFDSMDWLNTETDWINVSELYLDLKSDDLVDYMIEYDRPGQFALGYRKDPSAITLHVWCQAWEKYIEDEEA